MKWLRLWFILALAFAAGHVAIATLCGGAQLWNAAFWAQLAVVPAAESAVAGFLLTRIA
jgi:hypothetical protein